MKYTVNENCIGCGLCAGVCPEVFALGGDGFSHVKSEAKSKDVEERAEKALTDCPVEAIEHC